MDPAEPDPDPPAAPEPDPDPPAAPEPDGAVEPVEPDGPVDAEEADDLIELALASVELAPEGLQPATGTVSLVPVEGDGRLDIVMARPDAALVQEALAGIPAPRPRTHDLLLAVVQAMDGAVAGATLVERRAGGIYVARLRVRRSDGTSAELDARPSDALNVALRSPGADLRAVRALLEVPAN